MTARARLTLAVLLTACVCALEFWGAVRAGSLALLADAVHVCMDVFALGIALLAFVGAQRPATLRKTFGYGRLEVLGALLNGTVLLAATAFIAYQAAQRFGLPEHPQGAIMSVIAAIALIVNGGVGALLLRESKNNLNLQAALFHAASDALGALAVIAGGIAIALTRANWIDPALSLLIAAIIIVGVFRLLRDATDVLLEAVPSGVNVGEVRDAMSALAGVVAVHDLHLWTIGTGSRALSAHVLIDDRRVSEATHILQTVDAMVRDRFDVRHVTLQFECENCAHDDRVVCTQPLRSEASGSVRTPADVPRRQETL